MDRKSQKVARILFDYAKFFKKIVTIHPKWTENHRNSSMEPLINGLFAIFNKSSVKIDPDEL